MTDTEKREQTSILRRFGAALRFTIGVGLLVLAFRQLNLAMLVEAFRGIQVFWVIAAVLAFMLGSGLRILRWYVLVKPIYPSSSGMDITRSWLLGQATNVFMPMYAGDVVRAVAISDRPDERWGALLAVTVLEKAIVLIVVAVFAGLVISWLPPGVVGTDIIRLLAMGIIVVALVLVAVMSSEQVWMFFRSILARSELRFVGKLIAWGDRLVTAMSQIDAVKLIWRVFVLTLLSWAAMISTNLLVMRSLQMDASLLAGTLVTVVLFLVAALGLMPGNIGPFYFLARYSLQILEYDPAKATAFAVVLHAVSILPILLAAGIVLIVHRKPTHGETPT